MNRYRWNPRARQYIGPSGRFVPRATIARVLREAVVAASGRARQASMAAAAGRMSLDEWYTVMRTSIKDVHLYSVALGKGGWAQMTPEDYGRVGGIVARQYQFLDRFIGQLADGLPMGAGFLARVDLYMLAGKLSYGSTERAGAVAAGLTREQNFLGIAEHCEECLVQTALGKVPIGTLVPVGRRRCLTRCACWIEYTP